jgi:hypothetical protein
LDKSSKPDKLNFNPKIKINEGLRGLKALADIMNAVYSRDENGAIIKLTIDQISNYFDTVEGDDDK